MCSSDLYTREEKHLPPQSSEAINDMRREFDHKFCALLKEGVDAGEFVVDDVQITSLAIGGIISWSSVWYRPNGRLTQSETAEKISDLVLTMIQAKPKRRGTRISQRKPQAGSRKSVLHKDGGTSGGPNSSSRS